MNKTGLFFSIAFRFLKSSKKFSIINIISWISIAGVAIGVMALVVILSVFNGFEEVIVNLYNNYHADVRIEPKIGKTIDKRTFPYHKLQKIQGIHTMYDVIEDLALARYQDRQKIVHLKAVSDGFLSNHKFEELFIHGNWLLKQDSILYAIPGIGVEHELGVNRNDPYAPLFLYAPERLKKTSHFTATQFQIVSLYVAGAFSAQQEFDYSTIIAPIEVGKILYSYDNQISAVELILSDEHKKSTIVKEIRNLVGNDYIVKDIYQQQEYVYKILKSERLAILIILSFILLVAAFNVIGTLSLIVLEKRRDIAVLHSLGLSINQIRQLFLVEGLMIVCIGALLGLLLGYLLCYLQMKFGLIALSQSPDEFIIQYYPVRIVLSDLFVIAAIILVVGTLTVLLPVQKIQKQFVHLREEILFKE